MTDNIHYSELVINTFKNSKELVKEILTKYPVARDDDTILILYCMKAQGFNVQANKGVFSIKGTIDMLRFMKSFETLTRVRREIQNTDGILLPTNIDVANKRNIRQEVIRRYYRN